MRIIGLFLIAIGFIGGSLVAVLDPAEVDWTWFVPALAVGAVGVAVVQIAMRREATDTSRIEADFQSLDGRLRAIVDEVVCLDDGKGDIDVYDLPARIEQRLPEEIIGFADARASIGHAWGAQAYADIMSHFAAGERYLNRVWSCAADGYIDEAHEYLGRSREQFAEALAHFERAKGATRPLAHPLIAGGKKSRIPEAKLASRKHPT